MKKENLIYAFEILLKLYDPKLGYSKGLYEQFYKDTKGLLNRIKENKI